MALCLNISLRFLKTKKLSVSLVTECRQMPCPPDWHFLHMPFGKGQAVVWEWFSRFFWFCLFCFWWEWAMKAVCSTQTKGASTLSSSKNALFACSHLENCPENLCLFGLFQVSDQQPLWGGQWLRFCHVVLFVFCMVAKHKHICHLGN